MVRVKVPATTANLGPGFDVLGMALKLYNYIEMELAGSGLEIEIFGEGEENIPVSTDNIVYRAAQKVFSRAGFKANGLRIRLENNIPAARGLGSSAAALVGGALAANALSGGHLSLSQLIDIASEIEGHPDNVVPAMAGGITLCCQLDGKITYRKIEPPEKLKGIAVIPSFELSTRAARESLPEMVPLGDAVFNMGRLSLLIYAFQKGDMDLVKEAMDDRLHQPYRLPLIPGMDRVFEAARENGAAGVALSGSGPTVIAFDSGELAAKIGLSMQEAFQERGIESTVKILEPDIDGAVIVG
ncbi:MAG: homoserine kinase [Bacillota bacterium]